MSGWSKDRSSSKASDYTGVNLVVNIVHSVLVDCTSLALGHLLKQIVLKAPKLFAFLILVILVKLVFGQKFLDIILSIRSGPLVACLLPLLAIFHLLQLELSGLQRIVSSCV